ncbi:hypothetical protein KA344_13765 [bacterium]|jgi:hypothetical protein|nr:hypothetical protein [bacterium]
MELSDRLVTFLGKLDTDPGFQEFLTEFEPYLKIYSNKDFRIYTFNKLGFSFCYEEKLGGVIGLFFEIFTRGVRDGDVTPFEALLPFGVATSDTRQEVQVKLGAAPIRSTPYEGYPDRVPSPWEQHETWWDRYNEPMKIGVIFRTPLRDMDLFSVHYNFSDEAFASFQLDMVGAKQQDDRQQLSNQLRARNRSRRSAGRTHRHPKKGGG